MLYSNFGPFQIATDRIIVFFFSPYCTSDTRVRVPLEPGQSVERIEMNQEGQRHPYSTNLSDKSLPRLFFHSELEPPIGFHKRTPVLRSLCTRDTTGVNLTFPFTKNTLTRKCVNGLQIVHRTYGTRE